MKIDLYLFFRYLRKEIRYSKINLKYCYNIVSTMIIYILVFWNSADIKVFSTKKNALNFLINNNYKNIKNNNWSILMEDFENGEYVTLFNRKLL